MRLARLYPFTRHNKPRQLSAPITDAELLQHPCSDPRLKNGACSTDTALRLQPHPRRSALQEPVEIGAHNQGSCCGAPLAIMFAPLWASGWTNQLLKRP